jgi:two-component system NtrC family sensor kinase
MGNEPIKVLLVEDNPGDADLIRLALAEVAPAPFQLTHVERLGAARQRLREERFDVVLLDLALPDSLGLDTLVGVQSQAPTVPIVVLSDLADETLAMWAVQAGAQDYLVKRQVGHHLLARALRYAIERKHAEEALKQTAAELTRSNQQLRRLAADLEQMASSEHQARLDLQKAHEELKTAQSQLVQTEKLAALGQLVAGVAHEINNPLAFVINNIAVLRRDLGELGDLLRLYQEAEATLAEHWPEVFQRIRIVADRIDLDYTLDNLEGMVVRAGEGLRRIQQIVKDLRDFACLDEGDLKETDLNAGIRSTIHLLQGEARRKPLTLDEALSPLPGVICYPAEINQVVLNLVTNAIDACPAGGKVIVRTCPSPDGVEIHVSDTGKGIDPAIRGKIFDPFFTTKPVGAGRGLGLSISHGIVAEHGGRIEVDSAPGQGAHFTVHLPLQPPLEADARRKAKGAGVAVEIIGGAGTGRDGLR